MIRRTGLLFLAAGTSSRFAGRDKLFEMIDGQPMARAALAPFLDANISPPIILTRMPRDSLFEDAPVRIVYLETQGMGETIAIGMTAVPDEVDQLFVALADMPYVTGADIKALMDASDGERPVVPVHGRRGNPVLFPRCWFKRLEALTGDQGARQLLADAEVIEVPCSVGVLRDIDRVTDL